MRRRKGRKRPSPHQQPMPISTPSQRLIQYFFSPTINLVHTRVPLSVDHPTPLFFSLPLFWSHQYSCHPLTHVQSNSTFTFSRLICRCFHHFSGLPTTILTFPSRSVSSISFSRNLKPKGRFGLRVEAYDSSNNDTSNPASAGGDSKPPNGTLVLLFLTLSNSVLPLSHFFYILYIIIFIYKKIS